MTAQKQFGQFRSDQRQPIERGLGQAVPAAKGQLFYEWATDRLAKAVLAASGQRGKASAAAAIESLRGMTAGGSPE
jgi:hypothetical protein